MKSLGRKDAKYDILIIMTKKKNETNTKTKTQTKTNTLKKTKAKYRKDYTCAIFSKSRRRKENFFILKREPNHNKETQRDR